MNRMIGIGFCLSTHLGEIMNLIRIGVKDLTGMGGPSILTESRTLPAKATSAPESVPTCWAPQNTVFFC